MWDLDLAEEQVAAAALVERAEAILEEVMWLFEADADLADSDLSMRIEEWLLEIQGNR